MQICQTAFLFARIFLRYRLNTNSIIGGNVEIRQYLVRKSETINLIIVRKNVINT